MLAYQERWSTAGLATRGEMGTDCCYAVQNKTWVVDPDGNEWEAFVVVQDNLAEVKSASSCCAKVEAAQTACAV